MDRICLGPGRSRFGDSCFGQKEERLLSPRPVAEYGGFVVVFRDISGSPVWFSFPDSRGEGSERSFFSKNVIIFGVLTSSRRRKGFVSILGHFCGPRFRPNGRMLRGKHDITDRSLEENPSI